MFNLFNKEKEKDGDSNHLSLISVAALLIHSAKIDEDFTEKERFIIKKSLIEMGADEKLVRRVLRLVNINEFKPFPKIIILLLSSTIFTPIFLNAFRVWFTSSDLRILSISQIPFDIDGIIMDLWDIDLSPGILGLPLIPWFIGLLIILKLEIWT